METFQVELEPAEPDGFTAIMPAVPGVLVLGRDVDEVLERVRAAIAYHIGPGRLSVRLAVSRQHRGELLTEFDGPSRGQRDP